MEWFKEELYAGAVRQQLLTEETRSKYKFKVELRATYPTPSRSIIRISKCHHHPITTTNAIGQVSAFSGWKQLPDAALEPLGGRAAAKRVRKKLLASRCEPRKKLLASRCERATGGALTALHTASVHTHTQGTFLIWQLTHKSLSRKAEEAAMAANGGGAAPSAGTKRGIDELQPDAATE